MAQISFLLFPELFRTQSVLPDRKAFLRHTPGTRQIPPASAVCKVPAPYCPVRSKNTSGFSVTARNRITGSSSGHSPPSSPATAPAVSRPNRTYFRSRAEWRALRPSIFQARYKGCNSRYPRYRPRRKAVRTYTLHHRPPGRKPLISDLHPPPEVLQQAPCPRQSGLLCVTLPTLPVSGRTGCQFPFQRLSSFLIPQHLLLHTGSPVQGSRLLLQNTLLPASVQPIRQARPFCRTRASCFSRKPIFAAILRHEDADMVRSISATS